MERVRAKRSPLSSSLERRPARKGCPDLNPHFISVLISFFSPDRSREDDPDPTPLDGHSSPPPTKKPSGSGDAMSPTVSPEQISRMEQNKLEAEGKRLAKKFGVERIGTTWVKALSSEFKAPYMEKVRWEL